MQKSSFYETSKKKLYIYISRHTHLRQIQIKFDNNIIITSNINIKSNK